jgi:hypothetical protein
MERRRWNLLRVLLAAGLGLLAGAPGAWGGGAVDAASAFSRLKQLEGEWQGTTESGVPIVLRYHAGAGGTMLVETQSPGSADEMVSVYSINGSTLLMIHYCPTGPGPHGNQPRFRLDAAKSTENTLEFTFTGADNLNPAKDTHVHGARFVFLPDGRLERHWSIYARGKQAGSERFVLSRKP